MTSLVLYPWLAALAASALWIVWRWRRRPLAGIASGLWAIYCLYEYLMYTRVLCTGECNIRIDLLLIHPVIGIMTVAALVQSVFARRSPIPDTVAAPGANV